MFDGSDRQEVQCENKDSDVCCSDMVLALV